MTQLAELQRASFRGAAFLIGDVSTEGGRKQVVHEFPNSNRREIDDLGLLNKIYDISALVTSSDARDTLIRALDKQGRGELVHPMFGTVSVSSQPYIISESTRDLGVIRFQMSFLRSEEQLFPVASSAQQKAIGDKSAGILSSVNDEVASTFKVKGITNFDSAKAKLLAVADVLTGQSISTAVDQGAISLFSKAVAIYTGGLNSSIFDPKTLALTFTSMFTEFGLLSQDAQTMLNLTIGLIDFGDNDNLVPATTQARTQRENNRQLVNSATRFNAMAQSYDHAVNIGFQPSDIVEATGSLANAGFQTADDLEKTEQLLEEKYQALINDNNLSDELNDQLTDLRADVHEFMQEQTEAAIKIAIITDVKEQPMSILTYNYYGSTDNAEALVALNETVNVPFVSGTLKIITP